MLSPLATHVYQAAELEMDMYSSHIHVPNIPKLAAQLVAGFFFFPILDYQGTITQFIQAL
jgi:hypothetical protein